MWKLAFSGGRGGRGDGPNLAHVTFTLLYYTICAEFGKNRFSNFCVYKEQTVKQANLQRRPLSQIHYELFKIF